MAGSNLRPIVCSPYHSASASRSPSLLLRQTGAVYSHNKRCSYATLYGITPEPSRGSGDTIAVTKKYLPSFALFEEPTCKGRYLDATIAFLFSRQSAVSVISAGRLRHGRESGEPAIPNGDLHSDTAAPDAAQQPVQHRYALR